MVFVEAVLNWLGQDNPKGNRYLLLEWDCTLRVDKELLTLFNMN